MTTAPVATRAPLPDPSGPLTEVLFARLREEPGELPALPEPGGAGDHQLALYALYELRYGGWPDVDPEWEPHAAGTLRELEARFEHDLIARVPATPPGSETADVAAELERLIASDTSPSIARHIAASATEEELRELLVHRSADRLKETEPHLQAIARLPLRPKAAMVEILTDELGNGRPERMHRELYRQLLEAVGLDGTANAYIGRLPAVTLATVNAMSLFAGHHRWRGALVGHLAVTEMTSSEASRRYARGVRRLGFDTPEATTYFDEHVEADAIHDAVAAHDLAGGLAEAEPDQAGTILFGARALMELEREFAEHVLGAWEAGRSSLR